MDGGDLLTVLLTHCRAKQGGDRGEDRKKEVRVGLHKYPRMFPVKMTVGTIERFQSEPISHRHKDCHTIEGAQSCTMEYFYLSNSVICKVITFTKNKKNKTYLTNLQKNEYLTN